MRSLLFQGLILLAVIGLVFTPPVLTGYTSLQQADSAWESGDFSKAADEYMRAASLLPWRQDLWEQAAMGGAMTGNFEAAIVLFGRARRHSTLSAAGWDLLGQSQWLLGDHESALESWQTGLENYPAHANFYDHLSMAYYEQGNLSAEQDALENWVIADGNTDVDAHYRLGLLLSISDPDHALEEFLLASSLVPEYDPAVETMRTAINLASLESNRSDKLVLIGRGLGLVGEWELAAEAYRQAVAADGENAEAWAWLGEAEQQLGRDGNAELDRALSLDRRNPIVRSLRGLYWMRQGDEERALSEYKLAALYDPDNPAWQVSLGDAHARSGDLQSALDNYSRATEVAPTDAIYWRLLANFSAQYNLQIEEVGLPAAQMAVELTGEDPLALDTLGFTLTLLERYNEARDAFEHALSLDPDFAQGYLHLGVVALQMEDWESAKAHFQQARDLDPDGPVGEQAQVLLNRYFP
jgi:tetratricopeptide (TPR) repeat protein